MTPEQALKLAAALTAAANAALAAGHPTVSLLDQFHALDDAARAELDAAIKAARTAGQVVG